MILRNCLTEMKMPPPDNAGSACNRRRLFSGGGLVHRIGETPTRAAIQFNRQYLGMPRLLYKPVRSRHRQGLGSECCVAASNITVGSLEPPGLNCLAIVSNPFPCTTSLLF